VRESEVLLIIFISKSSLPETGIEHSVLETLSHCGILENVPAEWFHYTALITLDVQ
jgi:hypothetical protein